MKQLILLATAVVLLVASWWILRDFSGPGASTPKIEIPENLADKPALVRAALQLWNAKPDYYEPGQVANFLKLLTQHLEEDRWRAISAPAFFAFTHLRNNPSLRPSVLELENSLLPLFLRFGSRDDLEGLARMAEEKAFDSARISDAVHKFVGAPLGAGAFPGSRQEELIGAIVHSGNFKLAQLLVGMLAWTDAPSTEDKTFRDRMNRVIEACQRSGSGPSVGLAKPVAAWEECAHDTIGRASLQPPLENIAISTLAPLETFPMSPRVLELLKDTAAIEGADRYWDHVFTRLLPQLVWSGDARIAVVDILVRGFHDFFKKPGFEFAFWMRLATMTQKVSPADPLRAVLFLEKAYQNAATDAELVRTARAIVTELWRAYEFEKAKALSEQTAAKVSDPEQKKPAEQLTQEAGKKAAADRTRVAVQNKVIDLDLRRGRLQAMKDNLAAAKRSGRSPQEVQEIEKAIRSLAVGLTGVIRTEVTRPIGGVFGRKQDPDLLRESPRPGTDEMPG